MEKALLRNAMSDFLPEKIRNRKKSPYPKTHNPAYRKAVEKMLRERLSAGGALSEMIRLDRLERILNGDNETWFGQLMSIPQLLAWLVQFDYWCEAYRVQFVE